ncbi:carboxypeptidase-like regulatory domain-containing protein [Fimbriimonas ginsengisoli]|nr:carboxypeptidase-like regulatory domain-containing protein [Fimbriimonas ginsengisoli]
MRTELHRSTWFAFGLAASVLGASFAAAQTPAAPKTFPKGVLHGRVLDTDGKPVAGATVALQEKDGKVLTWTKTDEKGEYNLAADPKRALHLRPSRRRGLLEKCVRVAADVAMAPVKAAGSVVAKPGETVKAAAVSAATGNPLPLAGQTASSVLPNRDTAQQAREAAANTAVGNGPASASAPPAEKGQALLLISAPSYKDAKVNAGAYWLDPPEGKETGIQAWLETVKMASTKVAGNSDVVQEAVTLSDPVLEPSLVPPGGEVKIRVKLNSPPGPDRRVRVFAREARKNTVVELLPQGGADKNIYAGTLTLDRKMPAGETTVTLGGLRAVPVEVKLNPKKPDPLIEFVRRLDDMEAGKPYLYDPLIMASENRLEVKLTVLPK